MMKWHEFRSSLEALATLGGPPPPPPRRVNRLPAPPPLPVHSDLVKEAYFRWASFKLLTGNRGLVVLVRNGKRTRAPDVLFAQDRFASYSGVFPHEGAGVRALLETLYPLPFVDPQAGKVDTLANANQIRIAELEDAADQLDQWHGSDIEFRAADSGQIKRLLEQGASLVDDGERSDVEMRDERVALIVQLHKQGERRDAIKAKLGNVSESEYRHLRKLAEARDATLTKAGRPKENLDD